MSFLPEIGFIKRNIEKNYGIYTTKLTSQSNISGYMLYILKDLLFYAFPSKKCDLEETLSIELGDLLVIKLINAVSYAVRFNSNFNSSNY